MAVINIEVIAISGIPHLHRLVAAGRGDALAVGRPRHRPHPIGMTAIREEGCSYSVGWTVRSGSISCSLSVSQQSDPTAYCAHQAHPSQSLQEPSPGYAPAW